MSLAANLHTYINSIKHTGSQYFTHQILVSQSPTSTYDIHKTLRVIYMQKLSSNSRNNKKQKAFDIMLYIEKHDICEQL